VYLPLVMKNAGRMEFGMIPDPAAYSHNIPHLQTLGMKWVKLWLAWKDIEFIEGDYQWSTLDERIEAYSNAGFKILLTIGKAPNWARPNDDDKSVEGLPEDPQTYARFAAQVAARYKNRVQAIEVWDEQNIYYHAGGQGRIDAGQYMALLQAAYSAIKQANPNILVISGALTPTGAPQPWAVDDLVYLQQMYDLGLKEVSDAVGVQPSGFANPPDALYTGGDYDPTRGYDDHRSFFFRNTMEETRQMMVANHDEQKSVWVTSFGWAVWRYTGDNRYVFAMDTSLEEQGAYIRRAYEMGREWGWVGGMMLWNLDYAVTAPNTELANFSIFTGAGLTPAYEAVRDMPK